MSEQNPIAVKLVYFQVVGNNTLEEIRRYTNANFYFAESDASSILNEYDWKIRKFAVSDLIDPSDREYEEEILADFSIEKDEIRISFSRG